MVCPLLTEEILCKEADLILARIEAKYVIYVSIVVVIAQVPESSTNLHGDDPWLAVPRWSRCSLLPLSSVPYVLS